MSDHTHIEWTDATWDPITGCSVVSAGCKHCYAMKLAGTRLAHHPSRAGLTVDTKAGPVWNGQVRFNEEWLDQPLRWRRPRRIFVCAHGDLFHEAVPDEWIAEVFGVMRYATKHTFQVLTKRPERMLRWLQRCGNGGDLGWITHDGTEPAGGYDGTGMIVGEARRWPLPNVWLGVSVEDQATADERIPLLLECPAAVRWISAEPLLGPVDLNNTPPPAGTIPLNGATLDDLRGCLPRWQTHPIRAKLRNGLDWVVAGGESGVGARPMHPDWPSSLRDQCAATGVPFLFKQWGEWLPAASDDVGDGMAMYPLDGGDDDRFAGVRGPICVAHRHEFWRVGKKLAGRLLDGVLHDTYPEVSA